MPAITPVLLRSMETLISERLSIYADGPWQARAEFDEYSEVVQINVRGRRGYVFYSIARIELDYSGFIEGRLHHVLRNIESEVQDWLRANPPPQPREYSIRVDFDALARPITISQPQLDAVFRANKIDSTVIPEEIVPPEPPRRSIWERLTDDFLV
jgi:hypothetical protein